MRIVRHQDPALLIDGKVIYYERAIGTRSYKCDWHATIAQIDIHTRPIYGRSTGVNHLSFQRTSFRKRQSSLNCHPWRKA